MAMGHREELKTSGEWDMLIYGDYKYLTRATHKIKTGFSRRIRRQSRMKLNFNKTRL